jgi:hypothetical protein
MLGDMKENERIMVEIWNTSYIIAHDSVIAEEKGRVLAVIVKIMKRRFFDISVLRSLQYFSFSY